MKRRELIKILSAAPIAGGLIGSGIPFQSVFAEEAVMASAGRDLFKELGLKIKNYYFISETFFNRDEDKTAHKKVKLLLQHLVGYKTDGNMFTNEEIPKYEKIYFYDDEVKTLNLAKSINVFGDKAFSHPL